jgi:hypothetical protein
VDSGRFYALPAAALLTALLAYAATTRARTWGGTHALLP